VERFFAEQNQLVTAQRAHLAPETVAHARVFVLELQFVIQSFFNYKFELIKKLF